MNGSMRLSDRAMMTDILNSEKYAAGQAGSAVLESASPFVRRDFESIGRDCTDNVDVCFQLMNARGWYAVAPASQPSLSRAQQEVWPTLTSLGSPTGSQAGTRMTMGVGPGNY